MYFRSLATGVTASTTGLVAASTTEAMRGTGFPVSRASPGSPQKYKLYYTCIIQNTYNTKYSRISRVLIYPACDTQGGVVTGRCRRFPRARHRLGRAPGRGAPEAPKSYTQ